MVNQIMSRDVFSCAPTDSLEQAARIMWEHDVGVVPIVDAGNRVVGMLTDRDACMAAYTKGQTLGSIQCGDAMSTRIVSSFLDDDLRRAEQLMRDAQVRRLPVVDREGHLIGILSQNDLLREIGRHGREMTSDEVTSTLAAISKPRIGAQPTPRA